MSLSLHPSGFVESAGSCAGPRYVRSQPSRETGGVLLNECEAKYIPTFELPYRNMTRYIKEIQENWDRISPQDRDKIYENLIKNIPQLKHHQTQKQQIENMDSNIMQFITSYISVNPYKNTQEVLNAFYQPDSMMKQTFSDEILNEMQRGLRDWVEEHFHPGVLIVVFLLLLISCVILVAYNQSK